jgi:hypothetical protein
VNIAVCSKAHVPGISHETGYVCLNAWLCTQTPAGLNMLAVTKLRGLIVDQVRGVMLTVSARLTLCETISIVLLS